MGDLSAARVGSSLPDAYDCLGKRPPAGAVEELATWLRAYSDGEFGPDSDHPDAIKLFRAAELLQHAQAPNIVLAGPSTGTTDREKLIINPDPWQHRSGGMQCTSCMWFAPKLPDLGSPEWRFPEPGVIEVPAFKVGRCRRHAPTMNGFPVVFVNDWCGDHKLNENWQQSNEVQL